MFKHQEEEKDGEEERSQSPIKKRRMETTRYPRILLDHEQVPHSLDPRKIRPLGKYGVRFPKFIWAPVTLCTAVLIV
jgi:hypothetical protein